jgi:hypothetical protein
MELLEQTINIRSDVPPTRMQLGMKPTNEANAIGMSLHSLALLARLTLFRNLKK